MQVKGVEQEAAMVVVMMVVVALVAGMAVARAEEGTGSESHNRYSRCRSGTDGTWHQVRHRHTYHH